MGGGMGRQTAARLQLSLPLLALALADQDNSACSLKQVDVRSLKSWEAFTALFDDEDVHEPTLLKGLADTWPIQQWSLTRMVEKMGELEVWPRELREAEPAFAPRTEPVTLREFISEMPSTVAMHEAAFTNLTKALTGSYKIPRPFRSHVHTFPVVSIMRQGSGVGFHLPPGSMASWVGQVFGSTSFAFLGPGAKVKERWPWPVDLDRYSISSEGITCILEPGDGMFLPRNHLYSTRGEYDMNMLIGWQGETRDSGDLSSALNAISDGSVKSLEKAMAKWPTEPSARKQFLLPATYHAMQSGHIDILKMLKRAGAGFDEETPNGGTLLHQGTASGQEAAVRLALDEGADASVKHTKDGSSAVHTAAQYGHAAVMEVLLQKRPGGWKFKDDSGRQPMHISAGQGHTATMKVLLKYRAKVDTPDKSKFQPLHWAAEEGRRAAVELLLASGAKIDAKAWEGETPAMRAAVKGHVSLVDFLLERGASMEARRTGGQNLVHVAAFLGHVSVLKALHLRGANMTPASEEGQYTPESLAASAGHTKVLDYIREVKTKKVDFAAQDASLKAAVQAGHASMVKRLLDTEFKFGPPEERKFKIAGMATEYGHVGILDFALDQGELIKGMPKDSTALLQAASQRGHVEVLKYMAKVEGADINARDSEGEAPLLLATGSGHTAAVKALLKLRADASVTNEKEATALHMAVLTGRANIVDALLDGGVPLHVEPAKNADGSTNVTAARQHLHVSAATGHTSVAKALLARRADPMVPDTFGLVPLFFAAEQGHVSMLKLLVSARADIQHEVVDTHNTTEGEEPGKASALAIAGKHGHLSVLKYILQDYPAAASQRMAQVFGKMHGAEWQQKFEKAVNLEGRVQSEAKVREAMANPEARKNMEAFNKMYAGLSPKERAAMDKQLQEQFEKDEAKRKFEEAEERKRKRRLAEL